MVRIRKKKTIDAVDREILRMLSKRNPLVGKRIAKGVGISPAAIAPRLNNLRSQGILTARSTGLRKFNRTFGKKLTRVKAPRSIFWDIDLVKPRKKKR